MTILYISLAILVTVAIPVLVFFYVGLQDMSMWSGIEAAFVAVFVLALELLAWIFFLALQ